MSDINYELLKQQILSSNSFDECPKPPMTDYPKGANYVFISYSHKDYKAVYCDLLEFHKAGVRFWYDYGLPAGKDWNKVVEQKIKAKECSGVIFYLSSNLFLSRSVLREIEFTLGTEGNSGFSNKDYFCINLAGVQPSVILFQIIQNHSIEELHSLGVDTTQLAKLSAAFTDEATYIPKQNAGSSLHIDSALSALDSQFRVTGSSAKAAPDQTESASHVNIDLLRSNTMASIQNKIPKHRVSQLSERIMPLSPGGLVSLTTLPLRTPWVAFVLALFFGALGIDRFYSRCYILGTAKLALFFFWIVLFFIALATDSIFAITLFIISLLADLICYLINLFCIMSICRKKNYKTVLRFIADSNRYNGYFL